MNWWQLWPMLLLVLFWLPQTWSLTLKIQEGVEGSSCCLPPDRKETELWNSIIQASPSAGKNTGKVLEPCHTWKCVPRAIFIGMDILEVLACHLFRWLLSDGHRNFFKGNYLIHWSPIFLIKLERNDVKMVRWLYVQC